MHQRQRRLSILGILLNDVLFASFYPFAKLIVSHLDSTVYICSSICCIAGPTGMFLLIWRGNVLTKLLVKRGILLGGCLAALIITQAMALNYTTATEVAFFPSLNGLVAALFTYYVLKDRVEVGTWLAAVLAIIGLLLLTTSVPLSIAHWRGDGIALVSQSFLYTAYIFAVDAMLVKPQQTTQQTFAVVGVELMSAAVWAALVLLIFGNWSALQHISWHNDVLSMLYAGSANVVIPVLLFPFVQVGLSATTASFLYLLEPIFSALFAYVLLHERFSLPGYLGLSIIVMGVVLQASYQPCIRRLHQVARSIQRQRMLYQLAHVHSTPQGIYFRPGQMRKTMLMRKYATGASATMTGTGYKLTTRKLSSSVARRRQAAREQRLRHRLI